MVYNLNEKEFNLIFLVIIDRIELKGYNFFFFFIVCYRNLREVL